MLGRIITARDLFRQERDVALAKIERLEKALRDMAGDNED